VFFGDDSAGDAWVFPQRPQSSSRRRRANQALGKSESEHDAAAASLARSNKLSESSRDERYLRRGVRGRRDVSRGSLSLNLARN